MTSSFDNADGPQQSAKVKGGSLSLLVVGSLALDRLEREGWVEHRLGGVATYGGLTAVRLGCRVEAWSALPEEHVEPARRRLVGMTLWTSDSDEATRFVNREIAGGERQQLCPSQARMLSAADLPFADDRRWDWVHLGPLHPHDLDVELVHALRARCRVMSLDLQGYTRRVGEHGSVEPEVAPQLLAVMPGLDWVKASEAEWAAVAETFGLMPESAVQRFGWQGLLVSAGARGGRLYVPGASMVWEAVAPARVALETGAGDVFLASFVTHLLESGEALDACLSFAAHIASRHVAGDWLDLQSLSLPPGAA